ncbi:MAG: cell division protein FtsZ [Prevotellaceae bacterium]|jgi:cell division protein FtsZ|nr:cell division protein FtsZ [Prevotellaceae bacterium]
MDLMDLVTTPSNWESEQSSIIKVIGVGGGGNNAVHNMYNKGIAGVDFVICNTDVQVLKESPVPIKIQLGKKLTDGLGAGSDTNTGREAAEEDIEDIRAVLAKNTKMVFIAAGMGGGTGTGAAPIIAREAKTMDILTVAIVTMPYKDEGKERYRRAVKGLNELKQHVDSLLVINNQRMYEIYPDLSLFDAFEKVDEVVATAAKSIAELITRKGYINIDFADVKRFMTNSGMALMGLGRASGENRSVDAVEQALHSPLLNDNNITGAKNIIVNITSSKKTKPIVSSELDKLMQHITDVSGGNADCKKGVTIDDDLGEDIAVTVIATGFPMSKILDLDNIQEETDEYLQEETLDVKNSDTATPETNKSNRQEINNQTSPKIMVADRVSGQFSDSKLTDLETPAYERFKIKLNIDNVQNFEDNMYEHTFDENGNKHFLSENTYLDGHTS